MKKKNEETLVIISPQVETFTGCFFVVAGRAEENEEEKKESYFVSEEEMV